jgi:hypothetical protein
MLELVTYSGDDSQGVAAFDGDRLIDYLIIAFDSPEDNTIDRLGLMGFITNIVQACNQHVEIVYNSIEESVWDGRVL